MMQPASCRRDECARDTTTAAAANATTAAAAASLASAMSSSSSSSSSTSTTTTSGSTLSVSLAQRQRAMAETAWYPRYHIASPDGWLGVPGGLCYFAGCYHVFYQYNPYSANWGLMHWGHATSTDLVHWQQCAPALTPGAAYDRDGCFSGTAVRHEGKLYLFYTGHCWCAGEAGDGDGTYQQQCLAVSEDGVRFVKLGVVVRPPPGYRHFRDPKVWYDGGQWWMVCGARDRAHDRGQLLMFSSTEMEQWDDSKYAVLARADDRNVFMWECPDFFDVAGKYVLVFSPQGLRPSGHARRNRFHSGYLVGDWAPFMRYKATQPFRELDRGHDFYAPQTFAAPDGRRLLVAWLDMWGNPAPSKRDGWSGMLTLPRELVMDVRAGRLRMRAPRELAQLRRAHAAIPGQVLAENSELPLVEDCTTYEVELVLNTETSSAEKYGLWLGTGVEFVVDAQSDQLVLQRHYPQHMLSGYRSCPLPRATPLLHVRAFIDYSSLEVFVNDGAEVFTSRIYPAPADRALRVVAVNGTAVVVSGNVWQLQPSVTFGD